MRVLQMIGEAVFLLVALFNIGFWVAGGFRLPKYVHGIAVASFFLGCLLSYEIMLLGSNLAAALCLPFGFAGLVYFLFVTHGVGLPSEAELKQTTKEWERAREEAKRVEAEEDQD